MLAPESVWCAGTESGFHWLSFENYKQRWTGSGTEMVFTFFMQKVREVCTSVTGGLYLLYKSRKRPYFEKISNFFTVLAVTSYETKNLCISLAVVVKYFSFSFERMI